jgi:hypothetical protein
VRRDVTLDDPYRVAMHEGGEWRRRDTIVLLALVAGAAGSLPWLVHSWFEASSDASMYLTCARSLLAGDGYTFLNEPFRVRPPGMSALLVPVLALRGVDFHALNLYIGLWGVACAALFFAWARTCVSTWVALALAALLWFNPSFASWRNQLMSDVPGAALVFGCLLLERWCARKPSLRRDVVLAVALGLSLYVRSIFVVLVAGIALARLASGRRDGAGLVRTLLTRVAPLVVCVALVRLPWTIRDAYHAPALPADQTALFEYSTGMWHADPGDPRSPRVPLADVIARVPRNAKAAFGAFGSRLQASEPSAMHVSLGILFVLALAVQVWRKRGASELCACGSIVLVLPYFDFQGRLLLPALLIAWVAMAELLEKFGRRRFGPRGQLVAIAAACVLLIADFHPRANWEDVRIENEVCARWAERANELLPAGARVAVPMEGWRWMIWLDRPVWTLFFGWNRGGGPAGAETVLARHGIDVVLVTPFTQSDAAMRPWLVRRFDVLHDEPDVAVVRVGPTRAR